MSNGAAPLSLELELEEISDKDETSSPEPSNELPEKYRGKSVEEVARMHAEAEKALSRQGADLRKQRELSDMLIGLAKDNPAKVPKKVDPVTTDDLFKDPNAALQRTIETSPVAEKVKATEDRLDNLEKQIGQREFEAAHPTFREALVNPEFQDWVSKNPARTELIQRADRFDFVAAKSLFDMWEEHRTLAEEATKTVKAKSDRASRVNAAKTVKGASTEGTANQPIYSRAKLMDLRFRIQNGDKAAEARYNDPTFQKEMERAYIEGRVR